MITSLAICCLPILLAVFLVWKFSDKLPPFPMGYNLIELQQEVAIARWKADCRLADLEHKKLTKHKSFRVKRNTKR